jgi:hypothetical protein
VEVDDGEAMPPTLETLPVTFAESAAVAAERLAAPPVHDADTAVALQRALVQVEALKAGLQSRTVIGEAVGLLMGRYNMSTDAAFAWLVRESSYSNRKIRVIAEEIVANANANAGAQWPGGVLRNLRPRHSPTAGI